MKVDYKGKIRGVYIPEECDEENVRVLEITSKGSSPGRYAFKCGCIQGPISIDEVVIVLCNQHRREEQMLEDAGRKLPKVVLVDTFKDKFEWEKDFE